jgi:hypothetical protein
LTERSLINPQHKFYGNNQQTKCEVWTSQCEVWTSLLFSAENLRIGLADCSGLTVSKWDSVI